MAWTFLKILPTTNNPNIMSVSATWTDPVDGLQFNFRKDRVDPDSNGAKAQFKSEANAAKDAWQAARTMSSSEQTLLTQMNA